MSWQGAANSRRRNARHDPSDRRPQVLFAAMVGLGAMPSAWSADAASTSAIETLDPVYVEDAKLHDSYTAKDATTATKTDTPLIETPATVTVIPQQVILDQRAMGLDQVLMNAPGVYSTGYEPGSENIYIRGFNTSQTLWNGFRIDEYATTGHGVVGSVLLDNAEKVEILSGPASILYGRVEPGGMVNVITKQPQETFFGAAGVTVGSWRQLWSGIDLTGPINDDKTLLYRLNASVEHADSWMWGNSYAQYALAPVIEWRATRDTKVSIEGQFEQQVSIGAAAFNITDPTTGDNVPMPRPYSPLIYAGTIDLSRVMVKVEHRINDDWTLTTKALHTLSVSPVSEDDYIATLYFPLAGPNNLQFDRSVYVSDSLNRIDAGTVDLVGHVNLWGTKNTLLIGGDYYHQSLDFPGLGLTCCYTSNIFNPAPLPGNAGTTANGPNGYSEGFLSYTSNRNYGLYLQDQIEMPHDLQLLVGERYQHTVSTSSGNFVNDAPLNSVPVTSNPPNADRTFNPRLGLLWHPLNWFSAYYTYSTNFGINNGVGFGGTLLAPEDAKQSEVGVKTEFYEGKLVSNFAVYDLTKFHVAVGDPLHPYFSVTVGEVQSKGFDYSLQGKLTHQWDVIATASYTQPYVKSGLGNGDYASYTAGHLLPGVPERQLNLWAKYMLPQIQGLKLGAGANWVASTAQPLTPFETPAYWVTSAMAVYETKIGRYKTSVQLNVNNLLNKGYYTNLYVYSTLSTGAYNLAGYNYGAPREFRLSARVEF
jgi:iron complex outermembrane receptor protein